MSYADGDLSKGLFDGLLEMRLLVEAETARLAARRRSQAQLEELARVLAREVLAAGEGEDLSPAAMAALDYDFHLAVALASGNDVYALLHNSFKRVYLRILERFYEDGAVVPPVFAYHRKLVDAIAARDEAASLATMNEILEFGERNLRRILVGAAAPVVPAERAGAEARR
jgi:GntR family transcriptional repressor for pyruvate dehydrogenase complex